jgi:hypothetical protein
VILMRHLPSGYRSGLAFALLMAIFASQPSARAEEIPAVELVRRTVQNETKSDRSPMKFMFRDDKKTPHGTQSKLIIETNQALVGMTIANDGKPLSPEERETELNRLQHYVDDPAELEKKQRKEKEDEEHTTRIVKALPDAFIYEYGESAVGTEGIGKLGNPLVRLNFRPKPDYQPPTRVEQVLAGMQGYLLIDTKANRIAKIDGTLIKEVGFGWGILGHLDRGGHFWVEQGDAGYGQWEITQMGLSFTGKVLLFKGLNIQSEEKFSDFKPVAKSLTFAEGVALVKKESEDQPMCRQCPAKGISTD